MADTKNHSKKISTGGIKMRMLLILSLILFMAIPFALNAQERTLFKEEGNVESGFYCRPVLLKITAIDGEVANLGGIGGTWIIGHRVTLGLAWYWLDTDVEKDVSGTPHDLGMDYAGLELGYVFLSESPVHFTLHSLVGAGNVSIENTITGGSVDDDYFVIEPNIDLEVNVTTWFRACGGLSYRFIEGVRGVTGISDRDLGGLSGTIFLKFGWF
jgi:hypothetical protein